MHFAKHETFYIRDGWLYKGLKHVEKTPTIFLFQDAVEHLGLGKNMVRALRFWMQAVGLTDEVREGNERKQKLTEFGNLVLEYDPYQELDGTLWLLHYHLVSNREQSTSWYWFFNHYIPINFNRNDFIERIGYWLTTQQIEDREQSVAESSLIKDFDCLVKTYLPRSSRNSPEDLMESPLASLGLIKSIDGEDESSTRNYRLNAGLIKSIHPLIFLYVLLKRQELERHDAKQINLNMALRDPMNVGRTFNIGMAALEEMLMLIENNYPDWRVTLTRTGGLDQLTLPSIGAEEVLQTFYEEQSTPWI